MGANASMKIGIDARKIADTGIGRYIDNLIRALLEQERDHKYVLFLAPEHVGAYSFPGERVENVCVKAGKYSLREHWALGAMARRAEVDLFHEPHFTLPLYTPCKKVVTIHDVIHLLAPKVGTMQKTYARWMISSALKRADQVITVSNHTKENLVAMFGADPDRITVTYNAADSGFGPMGREDIDKELGKLDIAQGYFLFVGSDRPHKNIEAVANAMAVMRPDTRFVIVGRMAMSAKALFSPFEGRVTFVNNAGKKTITALYAGARALFFPSYMEGFGLPPLEAMACGTPTVVSNRSSIPEVVGEAAALVDPDDVAGAAELLERLRDDERFHTELASKGMAQAASFSWKETARRTLEVYERAMS
ncbi:MAG: glycosyltransferase family 4 protein [Nitrospinota bacterium]|nr:glycosyltransferase family 4 protein [Nitrospinota bacterium]